MASGMDCYPLPRCPPQLRSVPSRYCVRLVAAFTHDIDSNISLGLKWLAAHQNSDGGWGDTTKSFSNVSTTMLVRAAYQISGESDEFRETINASESYVIQAGGADAVATRYGQDRTFAVPILMSCALAGQVSWNEVFCSPVRIGLFAVNNFQMAAISSSQLCTASSNCCRTG